MPRRYKGWASWTIELRKRMYRDNCPEATVTIDEVAQGIGAETPGVIDSKRFWDACRECRGGFDAIAKQGLEIEFEPTADKSVERVTFRLNAKWMEHFGRMREKVLGKVASV